MADEKFSVKNVKSKMTVIQGYFSAFSDTLNSINGYVQSNVNAGLGSSAFGDLGSKLLAVWNNNSSTFNDFHENFDTWAQVVAIISANNNQFAVDAKATYRDNAGTLDGVKEAREFVSANNGLDNLSSASNYGSLSNDAKRVLDGAIKMKTMKITNSNIYGGKTYSYSLSDGKAIEEYYDKNGNLVGTKITDANGKVKYTDENNKEVSKLPTAKEYEEKLRKAEEERKKKEEEERKKAEEDAEKEKEKSTLPENHYLNYKENLKYGSFKREEVVIDGEKMVCYVYRPDYGTKVSDLPVMMYMTGANMTGSGEGIVTYGGLGQAISDKSITPSGIVVIPYVKSGQQYESQSYRDKLNKLPAYFAKKYGGDTNKLSLGGTSYGGVTAYKLVTEHPGTYSAVVTAVGANEVTDAFKGVQVLNFNGEADASNHTGKTYVTKQSEKVNKVGGNSKVINISKQWAHTNVGTYAFGQKYDCDGSGKKKYTVEWAMEQCLDKDQKEIEDSIRSS